MSLTKLPTYSEKRTPFLNMGGFSLDMPQAMTLVFSVLIWFIAVKLVSTIVGMVVDLPGIMYWLMFSWIGFFGLVMTFKKKDLNDNKILITYEEYLTRRILERMKPNVYVVKNSSSSNVQDADWTEIDEDSDDFAWE